MVSYGRDINNAQEFFTAVTEQPSNSKIYYIEDAEFKKNVTPSNLKPVPGTRLLQQIRGAFNKSLENPRYGTVVFLRLLW